MCGIKPYIRATCNPDPDSFVAELIEWWIDMKKKLPNGERNPRYGFPIPERAGVLRYFVRDGEDMIWGDTKQEVIDQAPHIFGIDAFTDINHDDLVKSITFIPGNIYENKELLKKDPSYLANLLSQDSDEKSRLLDGNWAIRVDELCIFMARAIENLFSNIYPSNTNQRYITCDAARFGNDLTTIFIWYGWKVVKLIIISKCDAQEIVNVIEGERRTFSIPKGKCIIDQDGVGGGVVKLGHYIGFSGNAQPMEDPGTFIKENYKNMKTQFYYRFADRVNADEVALPLSNENVIIDGYYGVKIKVNGVMTDVRILIRQDLRAIKKKDKDEDGKKQINSKDEQKVLLRGRSPDFADGMMLREYFEFKSGELKTGGGSTSILDMI